MTTLMCRVTAGGLLVGWFGLLSSASAQLGSWTQKADMLVAVGATPAVCEVDGVLHVIGGAERTKFDALKTVYAYNPKTDTWSQKKDMPTPRRFTAAAAVDGIIYVIGGFTGPFATQVVARPVEAYDPKTDTWSTRANLPTGRGGLAVCAVNGIIYAIGGSASWPQRSATVEAYNPATDQWDTKKSLPKPLVFVTASAVRGVIYAFMGTETFAYDPSNDGWTAKAKYSPWSYGHTSTTVGNLIYLFGGMSENLADSYDFALAYDPEQDGFTAKRKMPRTRLTAGCAAMDGKIYLAGGADKEPIVHPEAIYYRTLDVLDPQGTVPTTRYVAPDAPTPTPPYTNWAAAARVIQDAVDAAEPGDEIVVTNGVYATGGRAVGTNVLASRVAVDKPLTLRSVNGPKVTVIQGYQVPGTTNGDGAIRCVSLAEGASLSGFTLTNGATRSDGDYSLDQSGGGVWCESSATIVSNCILTANAAFMYGGGAYRGTLTGCELTSNWAEAGGGALGGRLEFSTLTGNSARFGGGAFASGLSQCSLIGNSAFYRGGGALGGTLANCMITGNSATWGGGLAYDWFNPCAATNCTLIGNSASIGGGAHVVTMANCIVYYNTATNGPNFSYLNDGGWGDEPWALNNCCTAPLPPDYGGSITNAPLFVDYAGGNLRLQTNSPCINAGLNVYATGSTDLDGHPRIISSTVDIGAYEFQGSGSRISYAWLQQFGLPTDASADNSDLDGDGHDAWQEWRCLTDPTNPHSTLHLLSALRPGTNVTLAWQSVAGVNYFLERSHDLTGAGSGFTLLVTNIPGLPEITTFTDTNAATPTQLFYRVGVQP